VSIKDTIEHFSKRETAPIELDAVVEQLRSIGVTEEIYYWTCDIDSDILRARLTHWDWPDNDGTKHLVVDIEYSKHLPIEWQRLVVCKELLHILDADSVRVSTPAAIHHLINRIVLPPDLSEPAKDGTRMTSGHGALPRKHSPWSLSASS